MEDGFLPLKHLQVYCARRDGYPFLDFLNIPMLLTLLFTIFACQDEVELVQPDLRPRVAVATAEKPDGSFVRSYSTVLQARRDVRLSARLGGTLVKKRVAVGSRVVQGELLLQLDSREADAQLQLAEARKAEAEVAQEDAALREARVRALGDKASGAELDGARLALQRSKALLDAARSQVALAALQLEHHSVHAPFAGEVAEIIPDLGEFVPPGQSVLRLVGIDGFRAEIGLVGEERYSCDSGTAGFFLLTGKERIEATLNHISPTASLGSQVWLAELAVPLSAALRAGQPVRIEGVFPVPEASALLPLSSIKEDGSVWAVSPGNIIVSAPLEIVFERDDLLFVDGVSPGTQVVLHGSSPLQEGEVVVPLTGSP
jgi:membrane fusion protein, multidrug efflux system